MSNPAPAKMKAYRRTPLGTRPVAELVEIPFPAHSEVLLKILAGGVCHSDCSILGPTSAVSLAFPLESKSVTLGHEGAGIIVSLGSSVPSTYPELSVGTYVAIHALDSCPISASACTNCLRGFSNICEGRTYGITHDGSWAPYAAVHASSVVRVPTGPDRIPPEVVCAATDAVITPFHAMKICRLGPAHTVLCVGVGGLGLNGVQIAKRLMGARCVIACDTRTVALENARAAGADHVVHPDELLSLVSEKDLLIDFAFDFVGTQKTFDACMAAVAVGGTIHSIGISAQTLVASPTMRMAKELTLKASQYGTREELGEVLQAIADGLLSPQVSTRPMSECEQVLDALREGKVQSRVALIPEYYPLLS